MQWTDFFAKEQERDQKGQAFPGKLAEQEVMNELKRQMLQQQGAAFPTQLEAAQTELRGKQFQQPWDQLSTVLRSGGANAATQHVMGNPALTGQFPAPNVQGNESVGGGQPWAQEDMVRQAMQQAYAGGPDVAKAQATGEATLPVELQKLNATLAAQKDLFASEVPGRIKIAQAGQGASAAEHANNRASQAAGIAIQNFLSARAISTELPLLEQTASAVKTSEQAATIINQIGALKAQVAQAGESSVIIGTQMGASASLSPQLQQMTAKVQERLDNLHRTLYNRHFGPAAKSTSVLDNLGPAESTTGYMP